MRKIYICKARAYTLRSETLQRSVHKETDCQPPFHNVASNSMSIDFLLALRHNLAWDGIILFRPSDHTSFLNFLPQSLLGQCCCTTTTTANRCLLSSFETKRTQICLPVEVILVAYMVGNNNRYRLRPLREDLPTEVWKPMSSFLTSILPIVSCFDSRPPLRERHVTMASSFAYVSMSKVKSPFTRYTAVDCENSQCQLCLFNRILLKGHLAMLSLSFK